jgi:hypothetical protein
MIVWEMQRLSAKLVLLGGEPTHWCPGCQQLHRINVNAPNEHTGALWSWDKNIEKPTFSPSVNLVGQCHYFLTFGALAFCADGTSHALVGKTVPLPDIPFEILKDFGNGNES